MADPGEWMSVLTLAAANGVGVVLFGVLYAVAGARWLPQSAFLICLVTLFALVTAPTPVSTFLGRRTPWAAA